MSEKKTKIRKTVPQKAMDIAESLRKLSGPAYVSGDAELAEFCQIASRKLDEFAAKREGA